MPISALACVNQCVVTVFESHMLMTELTSIHPAGLTRSPIDTHEVALVVSPTQLARSRNRSIFLHALFLKTCVVQCHTMLQIFYRCFPSICPIYRQEVRPLGLRPTDSAVLAIYPAILPQVLRNHICNLGPHYRPKRNHGTIF